ncbi:hypothetical protein KJ640_07990 [bacterium]|nr:hypothetical protein [bacterium]
MAQPIDIQVGFAQQISVAGQQQLHQQQPITHQEHLGKKAVSQVAEEATKVLNTEKSGQGGKIEEKRGVRRFIKKKKGKKKDTEQEKLHQKAVEPGKGGIIDVTV